MKKVLLAAAMATGVSGMALTGSVQALDMGNMMNPSKWFGNDENRDDWRYDDRRYENGPPPGYGSAPGRGYPPPGAGSGYPPPRGQGYYPPPTRQGSAPPPRGYPGASYGRGAPPAGNAAAMPRSPEACAQRIRQLEARIRQLEAQQRQAPPPRP
jgi:hypothetical protein